VQGLAAETTTSKGLKVFATIKDKIFETGRKVAVGFKENMSIIFDDFLGQWNYRVVPDTLKKSEVIF